MTTLLKKMAAICLALFTLLGVGVMAAEEPETITEETWLTDEKWGFETDAGWSLCNDMTSIWNETLFLVEDADAVLGGKKMLKLWADGGIDFYSAGVQTSFPEGTEAGKTYAISGFLKAEDMAIDSIVKIGFYNGAVTDNRKIEEYTYGENISDWTPFYFSPTQKYGMDLFIKISLEGAGTVYVDEVRPTKSDNLAVNGGFDPIYVPTIDQNKVFGWTQVSGRGDWGTNWFYDETFGCMRHEKGTNTWPYVWLPAAPTNKMQGGETYKISLQFKTDATATPLFSVATGTVIEDKDENTVEEWFKVELKQSGDADKNGFSTYESYFTMPTGKTFLGYVIMGSGQVSYYDNLSIEKAKNEAPVFTYLGERCQAFWQGNTIEATATVLAEENESAWMLMVLRSGKQMEMFEVTPVTLSQGINKVTGRIRVPKTTNGETLEAYCWKQGSSVPLTGKSVLPKGTGTQIIERSTAIEEEAWGFETNSLGESGADWNSYEISRRTPTSYSGIANTVAISKGTATLVSKADASEAANVKDGAYAAKLVGNANTVTDGTLTARSFVGIGKGYTQLPENSGKQQTIEGYMKIISLEEDARIRLVMRQGSQAAEGREIPNADILFMGNNTQGVTLGEWTRVQLTVPSVQTYSPIFLGLELVGEGTVYFDGFRLLEDTNLVTNGSFAIGYSNNFASNYQRTIYGWSAQQGEDENATSYKYNFRYDPTYACAFHAGAKDVVGYLYQNANAFNKMVPGQTYEISLAYHGSGEPTVIIGDTTVTLGESGKTTVRGTGDAAKTFTVYTGEYYLPDSALVPTVYKVSSVNEGAVSEYFADLTIYPV